MSNFKPSQNSIKRSPQTITITGQDIPGELPILATRDTIVFPHTVIPVFIDSEKSKRAIDNAMSSNRLIGVVAIKPQRKGKGKEELYTVGTVATIHRLFKIPEKGSVAILQGIAKIEILDFISVSPFYYARVGVIFEREEKTKEVEALMRNISNLSQRLVTMVPYLPEEFHGAILNIEEPLRLAYLICTIVKMKIAERQEILELSSAEEKLKKLSSILSRELELLELGGKIQSDVQRKLGKTQREYYLREQLEVIKKELGEKDESIAEIEEVRKRANKAKLTGEAKTVVAKEIKRLERIPLASPEHHIIRTYLDWILELPWQKETKDNLDLKRAKKILDEDHYDLNEVKERIIEYLAVRKLKEEMKGPILCFVGPPGVGKTSLGKSIARTLKRRFVRMSLGGIRDEAEIRGHRRTYIGALPGRIIQSIKRVESRNPIFMLDEIDKVGIDFRGDPSSALLEVLDPEQNNTFRDHYLDLDFDLSKVLFIATGNITSTIQSALLDRMEIIELPGYTLEEKIHIAQKYLIPKQILENGLKRGQALIPKKILEKIISEYTREAGVRNLEREIGKICRKVAKEVATGEKRKIKINNKLLEEYLGPEKIFPEVAARTSRPGVATGMVVTTAGGDIIFVECTKMPGKKGFNLTGQLGDIMKESAQTALSLVRTRALELGIAEKFFEKVDIHLHVPEGAVPKDGPSAGITMVTSLASLLTNTPVNKDVAMTGEITLTGQVLPVGGVKNKVLAARRAGIKTIIMPKKNEKDLRKVDDNLKKDINFVFVETIDEVLKEALLKKGKEQKSENEEKKQVRKEKPIRKKKKSK